MSTTPSERTQLYDLIGEGLTLTRRMYKAERDKDSLAWWLTDSEWWRTRIEIEVVEQRSIVNSLEHYTSARNRYELLLEAERKEYC